MSIVRLSCGPPGGGGRHQGVRSRREYALPPGAVGELWSRGPMNVAGYWNKPEATAATFVDGWVRTGDLARIDDEGFCFIIDRAKDMLIRGGENIYCVEVENALYEHPAVMDAAVVGRPHRTLGEEPVAVVTLTSGADASEDELRGFVAERLAAFKVPVQSPGAERDAAAKRERQDPEGAAEAAVRGGGLSRLRERRISSRRSRSCSRSSSADRTAHSSGRSLAP